MNDRIITGKTLKARGWPQGKIIGLLKEVSTTLQESGQSRDEVLSRLDAVRQAPGEFLGDIVLGEVARELLRRAASEISKEDDKLRDEPLQYPIWGEENIDAGALEQMRNAMRLPVAAAGALMPDAHLGYGLPIGGVLANHDCVIPYAVGVDIACRMRLSIYEQSPHVLGQHKARFETALNEQTSFGMGAAWSANERAQHEVLDDPNWRATHLLRTLQHKATQQLGTSGSGNHFVEWGSFDLDHDAPELGLKAGQYLALLSHSGSRGVGFKIANEYCRIARDLHPNLPGEARHLAWLPLGSEAGEEYWLAMELAGRFASANHFIIHQRVAKAAGLKEIARVENHHNFAWKEKLADGGEVVVHRKGATPAGKGVLGVIPGSMGDAGYVVKGKGSMPSLQSASHGAGRKMGRRQAEKNITKTQRDRYLQERGVTLLGGGIDEAPQAYKDIEGVVAAQRDLVEVIGRFMPRIVRMADEVGAY